ncbi:MAG: sigma-54 dependent transcriptional regulator [Calditrichia bacterium]
MTGKILIVDDEHSVRESLSNWLEEEGYEIYSAETAEEATSILAEQDVNLILLDIRLPGMNGLEFQKQIRQKQPDLIIIIMTAFASVDSAVEALKQGAYDYIVKPFDPDELTNIIRHALKEQQLESENKDLKQKLAEMTKFDEIIGESNAIRKVKELIYMVAQTDSNVLIRGESGTGKELIARAIHMNSKRKFAPIVAVNCGAFTETLLESELFGHEKGAFTGAQYRRKGKIELSNGGTLFLDEVGDISGKMQVDLLRVLENKKITRLGGHQEIPVDFRLICATNKNLEKMLEEGSFREDFYYRINVFTIFVPPLRERKEDIPVLADFFIQKYARILSKKTKRLSDEVLNAFLQYEWPGNIRELENVIERAMVIAPTDIILPDHIPISMLPERQNDNILSIKEIEKNHIRKVLNIAKGNISQAAKLLEIDRTTLYHKMKKYGINP